MVFRRLRTGGPTFEKVGLTDAVRQLSGENRGLLLVTGPTGSGKTTTLATMMSILNESTRKILTIEDPVEYEIQGVNQSQVKPSIGLTFSNALRSFLQHLLCLSRIAFRASDSPVFRPELGPQFFSPAFADVKPNAPRYGHYYSDGKK